MSYVESNLIEGEEVLHQARLHPILYAPSAFFAVVAFFMIGVGLVQASGGLIFSGVVVLALGAVFGLAAFIKMSTSEFVVTNRRVIIKVGWLRRSSFELLLPKVESIAVDQSILGRIFGFGSIGVRGTGGSREWFPNIYAPLELRRSVQSLLT